MILNGRAFEERDFSLRLRPEDEIEVSLFGTTETTLRACVAGSIFSEVIEFDGEPAVLWGYAPVSLLGTGCFAWMLTAPAVEQNILAFGLGASRKLLQLRDQYTFVVVCTDVRYTATLKWLAWLGFEKIASGEGIVYSVLRRD